MTGRYLKRAIITSQGIAPLADAFVGRAKIIERFRICGLDAKEGFIIGNRFLEAFEPLHDSGAALQRFGVARIKRERAVVEGEGRCILPRVHVDQPSEIAGEGVAVRQMRIGNQTRQGVVGFTRPEKAKRLLQNILNARRSGTLGQSAIHRAPGLSLPELNDGKLLRS